MPANDNPSSGTDHIADKNNSTQDKHNTVSSLVQTCQGASLFGLILPAYKRKVTSLERRDGESGERGDHFSLLFNMPPEISQLKVQISALGSLTTDY